MNLVEYYSNATNGFLFSNQCRKCGLCGVKNGHRIGHFGPRARNLCERVKAKLIQLQVHPIKPWKKESVQSLILTNPQQSLILSKILDYQKILKDGVGGQKFAWVE